MVMSSELFESRQDDFRTLCDDLRSKIDNQLTRLSGEPRKRMLREIDRCIEEGTLMVQELEDEVKKAPPTYRSQMFSQIRQHRRELEQITKDLKHASTGQRGARPNTMGFGMAGEFESTEDIQRSRLMAGSEVLSRASESIARSHVVAVETEQIGQDTMDELGQQRETLTRTRDRLVETHYNLSKSRKILNNMARRMVTNKIVLIVIIILELAILAGVIYWKFFS
ncbi:Vesicle transport through interaction with t-SNAREs 1B [Lamellibrachia satsuma]|nr:Vesicle transport through interaction with t-SNAREs 1B [Lamellibrachia satsuma]